MDDDWGENPSRIVTALDEYLAAILLTSGISNVLSEFFQAEGVVQFLAMSSRVEKGWMWMVYGYL